MARPDKQGLEYFPFDVDFFEDEKIAAISGEYGIKGEIIAIRLLCAIYREGYFILWSEMLKMKLLRYLPGISSELLEAVVKRLVKWGFFNETLFNSDMILTSKGIQTRFFQITKRRKISDQMPYLLVNVYNNSSRSELLHAKTPQSKVKESKEYISPLSTNVDIPPLTKSDDKKHSSECLDSEPVEDRSLSSDTRPPAAKTQDDTDFDNFKVWLRKNAANVSKMKEPFTMDEYLRIRKQYDPATVKEILLAMHNWKELNSKNVSANLTFRKWVQKEQIKHS